jgi:hypothetical protein
LIETYTSSWDWFYLYKSDGSICELTSVRDPEDDERIIGFNVADTWDSCPAVGEGWTYSDVTVDGDYNITSLTGPKDKLWVVYDYDTLFANYEEPENFEYRTYSAVPFEDYFDYDNTFGLFETYTSSFDWFYYYDSDG